MTKFEFRCERCATLTVLPDGGGDLEPGTCRPYCHPDDVLITKVDGEIRRPLGSMNDQSDPRTPPRADLDAWRAHDHVVLGFEGEGDPWRLWDAERARPRRSTTSTVPFRLTQREWVRL